MAKKTTSTVSAPSFADLINKNAQPAAPKAKKDSAPVLVLTPEIEQELVQFLAAKEAKKNAETEMKLHQSSVLEFARKRQDSDAFSGRFSGSYALQGDNVTAKYISADKFSAVAPETKAQLQTLVGNDLTGIVEEKTTVTLKEEVFSNPVLQKKLEKLAGDFADLFDVSVTLAVADGMNEKIYSLAGSQEKLNQLRTVLVQSSPYVK